MAEVMNLPADSLDSRQDGANQEPQDNPHAGENRSSDSPQLPPLPLNRRRDRDSKERRDDRNNDRAPNRGGGDYYDHNPPPLPPRDRERSYKRRLSPSPPPYRGRRRSPPFPPHKSSRRDDGSYDGRRGGYGNDRRSGYDYAGGYDREMGGRAAFGTDRPPGRVFGRLSGGRPDWNSGHDGYNDMSTSGTQREGLMSYKQFIQELEDDILPTEAERRYEEYKSEYITTQKRTYFEAHKDEEWLKNKYHPTNLVSVIERRNEQARKAAKDFLLDLHSIELDLGPSANVASKDKSGQTSEPNSEDEPDGGSKRRRPGLSSAKEADSSAAPKAHPVSSDPKRIQIDVNLSLTLVKKLDSEKGIDENVLSKPDNDKMGRDNSHGGSVGPVVIVRGLTSVKGLEGVELLDTLVTYLWRVHGVDYYGMIEVAEPKGLRHVRAEGKISDGSGDEWQKKLDSHWQERLSNQDPLEVMTGKEKIEAAAVEALDPYVRKIRDEKYGWKYGCGAKGCTKLFHAPEFVHKHLKLKHPELMMDLTTKVREDLYFQNYMNDPNAPGGQPVMQQSMQKDRFPRRGRPLDGRLKDDRGNRFGRDARGIINDRMARSQNLHEGDMDDPDKKNTDEIMFDDFGVHGPPMDPDIPPPVLMPVPGAGPLGPFVPAPPEVAMRMMREQGGPPPFEGGVRNGRLGVGGPPIIVPPNFPQDPRGLRSYMDLDAPEDEVTVIDYRSL